MVALTSAERLRHIKSLTNGSTHRVNWKRVNEARETSATLKRARTAFVEETAAVMRSLGGIDDESAPVFRSLTSVDEEELQREATVVSDVVYRSAPSARASAPTVTDEDRQMAAALNELKIHPRNEQKAKKDWETAMKLGEQVDALRAKADAETVRQMDAAIPRSAPSLQEERLPIAYLVGKGFDKSAKFLSAEADKVVQAELAAADADEFAERRQQVAEQASTAQTDTFNSDCGICLGPLAAENKKIHCGHGYCHECWALFVTYQPTNCALCREPLTRSDYVVEGDVEPPPRRNGYDWNQGIEDEEETFPYFTREARNDDVNDEVYYRPAFNADDDEFDQDDGVVYRSVSHRAIQESAPAFRSLGSHA